MSIVGNIKMEILEDICRKRVKGRYMGKGNA